MGGEAQAMTRHTLSRSRRALALAFACSLVLGEHAAAGQKVLGIFGSGKVTYATLRDPAGRFEVEYPSKDWASLPAGGSVIAIISNKDKNATFIVDVSTLNDPLADSEIMTNAKFDVDGLKEKYPTAKDFTTELLDSKAGKGAIIRYSRVGTHGAERVMRYVIGVEKSLFRVDGVVAEGAREKFEPVLMHMITSFKAPAGPAATKN
jgi:hypothetical protein